MCACRGPAYWSPVAECVTLHSIRSFSGLTSSCFVPARLWLMETDKPGFDRDSSQDRSRFQGPKQILGPAGKSHLSRRSGLPSRELTESLLACFDGPGQSRVFGLVLPPPMELLDRRCQGARRVSRTYQEYGIGIRDEESWL